MNSSTKSPKRRQPAAPLISLDQPGRLRFPNVMALLAISHQTLYKRMSAGLAPKPDGYDGVRPYWNTKTIRDFLAGGKGD